MKDSTVAQDAMRVAEALKMAVGHIEHLAAWVNQKVKSVRNGTYSFEALGEDLPHIKDAMMIAQTIDGKVAKLEQEAKHRDDFIKTLQAENARLMGFPVKEGQPPECARSPNGRHQVDTSMEEGPNNCFHCGQSMARGR